MLHFRHLNSGGLDLRYRDSIITYSDELIPVRVQDIREGSITAVNLINGLSLSDSTENFNSILPRLGYVKIGATNYRYLTRVPCRRNQQGLTARNIEGGSGVFSRLTSNRSAALSLHRLFKNDFDDLDDVVARGHGIFNRDWALVSGTLMWCGVMVGKLQAGNFELDKKYHYLYESLEELTHA